MNLLMYRANPTAAYIGIASATAPTSSGGSEHFGLCFLVHPFATFPFVTQEVDGGWHDDVHQECAYCSETDDCARTHGVTSGTSSLRHRRSLS